MLRNRLINRKPRRMLWSSRRGLRIEGKNQLVIGIGCTGGRHRSVTITNALYKRLMGLEYGVKASHRDISHDAARTNRLEK